MREKKEPKADRKKTVNPKSQKCNKHQKHTMGLALECLDGISETGNGHTKNVAVLALKR